MRSLSREVSLVMFAVADDESLIASITLSMNCVCVWFVFYGVKRLSPYHNSTFYVKNLKALVFWKTLCIQFSVYLFILLPLH